MKSLVIVSALFMSTIAHAGVIFPVCKAQNLRGQIFTAQAILSRQVAQSEALNKCYRAGSRQCRPLGCF